VNVSRFVVAAPVHKGEDKDASLRFVHAIKNQVIAEVHYSYLLAKRVALRLAYRVRIGQVAKRSNPVAQRLFPLQCAIHRIRGDVQGAIEYLTLYHRKQDDVVAHACRAF
jgi:hypothetical protein